MGRLRPAIGLLLVWVAALAVACAAEPRTEVIVQIEADPMVGARIADLHVLVATVPAIDAGTRLDRTAPVGAGPGRLQLPARVPLVPRFGDASRQFDVTAEAISGGSVIAVARARSGYVRHQTRLLVLRLEDSCLGMTVCSALQTCSAGRCVSSNVDPETLPPYPPHDGGAAPVDARVDGSRRDAGDAAAVQCVTAAQCDDGDPCTEDACDPRAQACVHGPAGDGAACSEGGQCCGGTCTSTSSDPRSCGACGRACGSNAHCAAGTCVCDAPFQDCDRAPGCESDSRLDPSNCGACELPCRSPTPSCANGACTACASPADCPDDGLPCTGAPICTSGACSYPLLEGACLIAGACSDAGAVDPANQCQSCQPAMDPRAWVARTGASCDDGQFCTDGDTCSSSATCAGGTPHDCSDGVSCTADVCEETRDRCTSTLDASFCMIAGACQASGDVDPSNSCQWCQPGTSTTRFAAHAGVTCDDGQFCTTGDTCAAAGTSGTCRGTAMSCSDGISCTTDTCNEAMDRCDNTIGATRCLIAGSCHYSLDVNPSNPCQACMPTVSQTAWSPGLLASCNDGMYCTLGDACDATGTCTGTARSCDDGDSCTTDVCDETADTCTHAPCGANMTCGGMGMGRICRCVAGAYDCDGAAANGCECTGAGCMGTACSP